MVGVSRIPLEDHDDVLMFKAITYLDRSTAPLVPGATPLYDLIFIDKISRFVYIIRISDAFDVFYSRILAKNNEEEINLVAKKKEKKSSFIWEGCHMTRYESLRVLTQIPSGASMQFFMRIFFFTNILHF